MEEIVKQDNSDYNLSDDSNNGDNYSLKEYKIDFKQELIEEFVFEKGEEFEEYCKEKYSEYLDYCLLKY